MEGDGGGAFRGESEGGKSNRQPKGGWFAQQFRVGGGIAGLLRSPVSTGICGIRGRSENAHQQTELRG